jgi:hypothetical protein
LTGFQGFDVRIGEQGQGFALAVGLLHGDDRIIERVPRPRRKTPKDASCFGGLVCHPTSPLFFVLGLTS